jgi:DNA helicase-2/ATP-dependent DNA helicase PcrA
MRLIANPDDNFSLARVINTPSRMIGTKTYAELITAAQRADLSPGALLLRLGEENAREVDEFSSTAGRRLGGFGQLLVKWCRSLENLPPVEVIDQVLEDTEYRAYIEDGSEEGYERWENVIELKRLASEYQTVGLLSFLEDIALVSDQDTIDSELEVPTLLTLHSAKGLEFKQVIIIGLNDGIIPHLRSFDDPEAMEEERRLFYVGVTRAKDRLYLIHSLNRYSFGYFEPLDSSRYYRDIPVALRAQEGLPSLHFAADEEGSIVKPWKDLKLESPPSVRSEPRFRPGQKVVHPSWGEGVVLNSVLQDDDEILDVFFEGVGKKKLIASLADLKISG